MQRATCSSCYCLKAESKNWYTTSIVTCLALLRAEPQYNKAVTTPTDLQTPFQVRVSKACTFFNTHLALFFFIQMNRVKLLSHLIMTKNKHLSLKTKQRCRDLFTCVSILFIARVSECISAFGNHKAEVVL